MNNFINTCMIRLNWPQEIKDEIENTLGNGASFFNYFELHPEFALQLRTGDHINFCKIHLGGYPYIKYIQPKAVQVLDYLSYYAYFEYLVSSERRFSGNAMYLQFELDLHRDYINPFSDTSRMDYFSTPDRFQLLNNKQMSDLESKLYLDELLKSINQFI